MELFLAKGLMYGDYVTCQDGHLMMITAVYKDSVDVYDFDDEQEWTMAKSKLWPIEVSEKFWFDNGFQLCSNSDITKYCYQLDSPTPLSIRVYEDKDGQSWSIDYGEHSMVLDNRRYVHQLQHALCEIGCGAVVRILK